MNYRQWFLCARQPVHAVDELSLLRAKVIQIYEQGVAVGRALLVVAAPPGLSGFDRLAVRLSFARILGELTAQEVTMAPNGLAVALLSPQTDVRGVMDPLRRRLLTVTTAARPPLVWAETLPVALCDALALLDDLAR